MSQRHDVILDVDPGNTHDDAIAMLVAGQSEEINLKGFTVTHGNNSLENCVRNALDICGTAGLEEFPVYAGMTRPMVRIKPKEKGEEGASWQKPSLPSSDLEPAEEHAVDFIIESALSSDAGGLVLIPVGPLTNIGMALVKEPKIKEGIKEIIWMGGACTVPGNVTPVAEANSFWDPEAAKVVFNSGVPITMAGLGLTHQAQATPEKIQEIRNLSISDQKTREMMLDILEVFRQNYKDCYDFEGAPLHDVVALSRAINEDVFTTQKMRVDIEVNSDLTYGTTVCNIHDIDYYHDEHPYVHKGERKKNANVGLELNKELFWSIVKEKLAKY